MSTYDRRQELYELGINSIYVLSKDESKITFIFYVDNKATERIFDLSEQYYSYVANDDTIIEVNKPIVKYFNSYKSAWIEIKELLKDGYEFTKKESRSNF